MIPGFHSKQFRPAGLSVLTIFCQLNSDTQLNGETDLGKRSAEKAKPPVNE